MIFDREMDTAAEPRSTNGQADYWAHSGQKSTVGRERAPGVDRPPDHRDRPVLRGIRDPFPEAADRDT
jgi:hypothetical protein